MAAASGSIFDVAETRLIIERWAAETACLQAADAQLEGLGALLKQMDDPGAAASEVPPLDSAVPHQPGRRGNNPLITGVMGPCAGSSRTTRPRRWQNMGIWPEVAPRLRADHRMILGAVTQRDAAVAVDAVTAHLTDDYPELTSTRAHRTRYLSVAKGSRE